LAKVTFDLPSARINVSDINATPGGGFVMLKGGIINTSTVGSIASAGGSGQVRFNNATSYPVVMNGIRAAASGSSTNP